MAMMDDEKKEAAPAVPEENVVKKPSVVKWAIVGAILLLFIGMQVAMAIFFTQKLNPAAAVDIQDEEAKKQEEFLKVQKEMGVTLAAPIEITVNISGEDGRFIKCGVQLEYSPSYIKLDAELEARKVRIKDIIIDIVSSRSLADLMTNEGKKSVRDQIVHDINDILPENDDKGKPLGKISRSYFDSFMIQ
jgi:flagellar FliL protein